MWPAQPSAAGPHTDRAFQQRSENIASTSAVSMPVDTATIRHAYERGFNSSMPSDGVETPSRFPLA
jgi:hypothetical protein